MINIKMAAGVAAGILLAGGTLAACGTPHDKPYQAGYSTGQQMFDQLGEPDSAKSDPSVMQYCDQSLLMLPPGPYAGKVTDWTDGYEAGC